MHFGTIIRSPISKGSIDSIKLPSNIPNDFTFCRLKDIPGENKIRIFDQKLPLLADKNVEYEGQPLLLLSSASAERLENVAKKIFISYQQEPALPSIGRYESTQIMNQKSVKKGNPDKVFKKAFQVIESKFQFYYQGQVTQDPEGAYAEIRDGVFHIYATTNWPAHVRRSIAKVFSVPEKNVMMHPLIFPPSYDAKLWRPTCIAVYAALLAWKSKRAVRIMVTPQPFTHTRHTKNSSLINVKSAMSRTGALEALDVDIHFDCGAFPVFPDEVLRRSLHTCFRTYPCANFTVKAHLIKTNTPPAVPTPAFGTAHILSAMEINSNRLAELANQSPGTWRMENIISKKTDPGISEDMMRELMDDSDYERKFSGYEMMKKRREGFPLEYTPVRGIALATGTQGSGFSGPLEDVLNPYVAVRLDDERKVTIITSAVGRNNSIFFTWKELVGTLLDLPPEAVRIDQHGLEHGIDSGPSVFSRNIAILTPLLKKCCEAINKKRFRSPLPIEVKRSIRISKQAKWNEETGTGALFQASSHGASVVELEINAVTLEMEIRGIWLYAYCGGITNRELVENTLESGIFHAIRWVTGEDIWLRYPRETGLSGPENVSLTETDIMIKVFEGPKKTSAAGIEMLPFALIPAAFVSALSQAANIYFDTIPQYPETIQQTLEEM